MAASYPTSAKSFSTKATNDSVEASHVNDLQDEVTAIETALVTGGIAHALFPSTSGTRDLGTSSLLFRTAYLDTALILGAASTAGVRLDLDTGVLEVREGDDSAYAALKALTLEATSNATVGGALSVTGASTLTGAATLSSTLDVTGATTLSSTLDVTGVSTFTGDVKTTGWTDYSATSTVTGWAATPTTSIFYKKVGKFVFVVFSISGTSDATSASFTLPVASASTGPPTLTFPLGGEIQDNSAAVETGAYAALGTSSSTVTTKKSAASAAWTASGTKAIAGQFCYEAAS